MIKIRFVDSSAPKVLLLAAHWNWCHSIRPWEVCGSGSIGAGITWLLPDSCPYPQCLKNACFNWHWFSVQVGVFCISILPAPFLSNLPMIWTQCSHCRLWPPGISAKMRLKDHDRLKLQGSCVTYASCYFSFWNRIEHHFWWSSQVPPAYQIFPSWDDSGKEHPSLHQNGPGSHWKSHKAFGCGICMAYFYFGSIFSGWIEDGGYCTEDTGNYY